MDCYDKISELIDVVFLDPIWGADYKKKESVTLSLINDLNLTLEQIISNIINKNKSVIIKVPLNYNVI